MPYLTDEEIAYFSRLLTLENDNEDESILRPTINVETEIPEVLVHILGRSKLTLLAEISYYRLFFPLEIKSDKLGILTPIIGTPDVIDIRGADRSWRLDKMKGVTVVDNLTHKGVEVLSLSNSGMTVKVPLEFDHQKKHISQLILPNGDHLDVAYEEIRTVDGVMAVKISANGLSREVLRKFLFNEHKAKYSHLYKDL